MQNLQAEPPQRTKLEISGNVDEGKVVLGGVDVTKDLDRLVVDLTAFDCVATLELRVDVDFDFPVTSVAVAGDPLEGLTAKELQDVVANCPIDMTLGDHVLKHLQSRAAGSAQ